MAVNAEAIDADPAALLAALLDAELGVVVGAMTEVLLVELEAEVELLVLVETDVVLVEDAVADVERAVPVATLIMLPETVVPVPPTGAVLNGITNTVTVTVLKPAVMAVGFVVIAEPAAVEEEVVEVDVEVVDEVEVVRD